MSLANSRHSNRGARNLDRVVRGCCLPLVLCAIALSPAGCAQPRRPLEASPDRDAVSVGGDAASDPSTQGRGRGRVVEFRPGIRIDYRGPQVEVAGEVILRQGQLELFAYSKAPTPKEHETILRLDVRPELIYQALGLIGLTPGHPMSYDWETETTTPAQGDPVDVSVRFERDGETVEASACDWLWDVQNERPLAKTHWLFAGSRRLEDGQFFADIDGTVVTVVNFDSALLSLPGLHSDSNAELWLTAHTEAIPPKGTKVTMILRPHADRPQESKH